MTKSDMDHTTVPTDGGAARTDRTTTLTDRLFAASIATMEIFTVHLGVRLGLYRTLHLLGTATPRELAESASIHARYAREWLEQQASAGLIDVDTLAADPYASTYRLPDAHVPALLDADSPLHIAPIARFMAGISAVLPDLLQAFRTGGGVSYAAYGEDTREGIAGLNRPMFRHDLATVWLAALPDIHERLTAGSARVLDLGCGQGWSSIALAQAFPGVRVDGFDLDAASIEQARRTAQAQRVADRVTFSRADATAAAGDTYDLVCVFEAMHDMADPVRVLAAVRPLLAPGGAVLVADEKVADAFTGRGDELERLNYAFSVLHCLPATRAEGAVEEAGTVLREATMRGYAERAGFSACRVLPVEHDLWRFYRLDG
jgi:SAM-dependent methyltransferase